MEFLLVIALIMHALGFLLEKVTNLIKQLKSSGSAKLTKGFQASLSVTPVHIKSEDCATNTSPPNESER